jgi:putative membrane protein insertion efficiency factor
MGDRRMAANLTPRPFPEPHVEPNSKGKLFQGLLSSFCAGWAPEGRFAPALVERNGPRRGLTLLALGSLRLYRFALSPLLHALFGSACRFEPSCSRFAADAIREHGLGHGAALTIKRLARCHPLGGHGYDPVPATDHSWKK